MASQNCRPYLSAWPQCAHLPEPSNLRALPKHPLRRATGPCAVTRMAMPEEDWQLMFDAVKSRLSTLLATPATAAVALAECVEALDRLQKQLPRGASEASKQEHP
ncbi:MAG: hypothetical protein IV107_12290 [Paucibacter sp.]|nr:hypothetical protein [Roseateles sp.]